MSRHTQPIALTGASGFVGRAVLRRLLDQGYTVRALDRRGKLQSLLASWPTTQASRVEIVLGDLFDGDALKQLVEDCGGVIHLVGIIREMRSRGQTFDRIHHQAVTRLVKAVTADTRFIHMSALGTRPNAESVYHQSKWQGEQAVRASRTRWTIFRPSLIHGPNGEFINMVKSFCKGLTPAMPYFGGGLLGLQQAGKLQPVFVEDIATLFVQALDNDVAVEQTYEVGGPDVLTWPKLYRTVRQNLHLHGCRRKPIVPVPAWLALCMARMHLPGLPFGENEVIMSQEDSVCDNAAVVRDFDVTLKPFESTVATYIQDP